MLLESMNFAGLLPELLMLAGVLGFLLLGVFGGNQQTGLLAFGAIITMACASGLIMFMPEEQLSMFDGLLVGNGFIYAAKLLVLLSAGLVLIISSEWLLSEDNSQFEYPILILLATVGMMVMLSAGSLLTLYMGLELMSLPLYVLASIQRDSLRSTEAGLKYFVLGSLASGIMLFGASLVYGFSGTLSLDQLAGLLGELAAMRPDVTAPLTIPAGLLVGLLLVIAGFCFKISAVPFHMWAPDVYEGAPTPVTAFFAVAPKIAALCVFARLLTETFGELIGFWQQVIVFVSVASMLVGALGAIMQTNIKRLLAYSSIGHVGYVLIAVATGTDAGMQGIIIYLSLYLFMSVGAFACVLRMRRKGEYVEDISELAGLAESRPRLAAALAVFMLSMAGIPPLAGFFGKFYIFLSAIESGLYVLATLGVIASVIAAYYYLKIVKLMYFDEAKMPFDREMPGGSRLVMAGCAAVTLLFFLYPTPLVNYAGRAAQTLAHGEQTQ